MLLTASILDRAAFFAPHFSFGLVSPAGEAEVCWYSLAYKWVSMPAFFAAVVSTRFPAATRPGHCCRRQQLG